MANPSPTLTEHMASEPRPSSDQTESSSPKIANQQDPFKIDYDPPGSSLSAEQIAHSEKLAKAAVKAAAENRGQDIMLLDLTEQTAMFDFFVIASGSSRRQLGAMASEIDRVLKYDYKEQKLSVSGLEESRWVVLDYGTLVVHLFDEETRGFYDLESLWADGREVDISDIIEAASAQMTRLGG